LRWAREGFERRQRPFGDEDLDVLQSMNGFGRVLTVAGKYDQAEKMLRQTVKRRRKVMGEKHAARLDRQLRAGL